MVKRLILSGLLLGMLLIGLFVGLVWWIGRDLYQGVADSTQYSSGYSEAAFEQVQEGMTQEEVVQLLGQPLRTHAGHPGLVRWYGPPGSWVGEDSGLHTPEGSDGSKAAIIRFDLSGKTASSNGPFPGKSAEEVRAALGEPIKEQVQRSIVYWRYSQSPSDGSYHRRWIGFDADGRVAEKKAYFWWD